MQMLDTDQFNVEAYNFVKHLVVKDRFANQEPPAKEVEIVGIPLIANLGEVHDFDIEEFDEDSYQTKRKFKNINGQLTGLDSEQFGDFKDFLLKLYESPGVSEICDLSSLIDFSFEWLLDIHISKRASKNLTAYIYDKIDVLTKSYFFYFKLEAIGIEQAFIIGNAKISNIPHEDLIKYYEESKKIKPERTLDEFKELFKSNFNEHSINAIVETKGIISRAEEKAFADAEIAIDVLKCFCCEYSVDKHIVVFDIDHRFQRSNFAHFVQMAYGDINQSQIRLKQLKGVAPIRITKEYLNLIEQKGLNEFSSFIKLKKKDELYLKILTLIRQLSSISSTYDNHEKTVKAISLFESICIPLNSNKSNGMTHLKRVAEKLFSDQIQKEEIISLGLTHYKIRDKYLHNDMRWPLNKKDLVSFLAFERYFILVLIRLNNQFSDIEQLLAYFEIRG
jgi:hypothetical protein